MRLRTLGKALAFCVGGAALGVGGAVVAGYPLQSYIGENNAPLLWLVGGIGGFVLGLSQASWRRRRRRRRRHPQVVLPPMKPAAGGTSTEALSADAAAGRMTGDDPRELFRQATGATLAEVENVRVCDIRLDSDGEPLSVRLSQDHQEREVFLVHEYHRDVVAEALEAALRREPGNRRAKLFV
ncbi:MAG: hypothetical protein NZ585_12630 [Chloracidobacterium sp.]|nr:hypothetical protein [Chloracidobacterium sp.]MDW8217658.1 hypothetical protein [Acidobacteriota bacterium]